MPDWTQLLNEHGGLVWATIFRLVPAEADAADCFQETFLSAWEVASERAVQNWPGLLKRLATVRALDSLRKRQRTTDRPSNGAARQFAGPARQPVALAEEQELFDRLRDGLARLPPDQAQAWCLRSLEGCTYQEIAEELDMTVNHVGVLLHRAKAALQKELAGFAPTSAQGEKRSGEK